MTTTTATATAGVTIVSFGVPVVISVLALLTTYTGILLVARNLDSSLESSGLPVKDDVDNGNVSVTIEKLEALLSGIEAEHLQITITDGNLSLLTPISEATSLLKLINYAEDFNCTPEQYTKLVELYNKVEEFLDILEPVHDKLYKLIRLSEEGSQIWASHPELHVHLDNLNYTEPLASEVLTLIHSLTDLGGNLLHFINHVPC